MGQNLSSEPVVEKDTERAQNETFSTAVSSCQGWRMTQEDDHSLMLELPGEHKASFFAVYDGHGSGRVSEHASQSLWRHLSDNEHYQKGMFKEALEDAFLTFDREVKQSYNAELAGTTAICTLIVDNIIYCANIGDSRAVASVNCECVPLSHDHKPENPLELKRILAAGGYVLGNRVNGNLALSRAFGDFHYKANSLLPVEHQIVVPCPDINMLELNDDLDFLVLACDGIWDVLSSEEVVEFVISRLERNIEPGLICEQLTTRCLAPDYELVIGCDNMTVLLVCHLRGRSWNDYCTDIFNKNSKRLGGSRTRPALNDTSISESESFGAHAAKMDAGQTVFNSMMTNTNFDTTSSDPSSSSTADSWVEEQLVAKQLYESTLDDKPETEESQNQPLDGDSTSRSEDITDKSPDSTGETTNTSEDDSGKEADKDYPGESLQTVEPVVVEVELGVPEDGDSCGGNERGIGQESTDEVSPELVPADSETQGEGGDAQEGARSETGESDGADGQETPEEDKADDSPSTNLSDQEERTDS